MNNANTTTIEGPHAELVQMLSSLLIQLNALQMLAQEKAVDLPTLREGMDTLEQMAREALFAIRSADEDLPPVELEGVTLSEALSRLVEETAEAVGISSRVSFNGIDEQGRPREHTLSPRQERILYFIAREALYQVPLHTGVRRVRLVLTYGNENVQMSIEDDGTLPPSEGTSPLPLLIEENPQNIHSEPRPFIDLRHRIMHLGGTLETTQDEQGTHVLARLPYIDTETNVSPSQATPVTVQDGTPPITILIVDAQAVTRAGLHRLLDSYAGLHVVGEAADGVQAVSETLELGPQIVLLDSQLPNGQSLDALRQIKQLNLDTKVLLLSAQDREEYLYETLRSGADGYVLKDIAPDELAQALRVVASGEVLVQPQLAGRLLSRVGRQGRRAPYESLTARELDVLRLLARGMRNKEIAARLYVSERTVNFHLANIYQKLNVSGRTEALSKAIEQGLVTT
jgi:DNA-binding NarL/FixJ family response regulator